MSSGNQQGEPVFLLLMVLVLLAGLGWLVWHVSGGFWLDYFFRWLRFGELWPIHFVTGRYGDCLNWLRTAPVGNVAPSPDAVGYANACFGAEYLQNLPNNEGNSYYSLSVLPIAMLGAEAMAYYRWPIAAALVAVGVYVLWYSPRTKFMTKHTLESFIETQAKMWPIISPIVKFNPSKSGRILGDEIPEKLPIFAEALSPEEWVSWNRIPVVNGIPDRDATRRSFMRQLGPRWNGVDELPDYMKALVAAFAVKGAQKRDASDDLLGRIALAWSPEKGLRMDGSLIGEINDIIRDPEVGGKGLHATNPHAYRTTAILGLLRWARANGGVLAPAQFLWLRAEDRALWYPLNNLGRRSFHSEGAGAMAHFMAELAAQKALPIPRIDTAIVTLNTYLHDPDKRPIPIPPREGDSKAKA